MTLHTELDELTDRRRPEVISRIKAARELGDLSENADYEAARKEQSFLEGRVQQLEQMIKYAVMIEASSEGGTEVVLGSTVVINTTATARRSSRSWVRPRPMPRPARSASPRRSAERYWAAIRARRFASRCRPARSTTRSSRSADPA